jgi:hypothetical protein
MLGLGITAAQSPDKKPLLVKYSGSKFIAFDGVNEYGELLASDSETFMEAVGTTGGTVSFWVRSSDFYHPTNNANRYMMGQYFFSFPNVKSFYIGTRNDSGTNRIVIFRADLDLGTSTWTRWADYKTSAGDHLTDDTWHHIAIVMKPFGASWRTTLYVDGSSASLTTFGDLVNASNTDNPSDPGMNMTISRYNTIYGQFDLNEIAFWSSELSSSEISYIYDQGLSGFDFTQNFADYQSKDDLYAWYKMGDDPDSTDALEPDSSGNDRDMTLYNTPARSDH